MGSNYPLFENMFGILILDAETGVPIRLNYTERTEHSPSSGIVQSVSPDLSEVDSFPTPLRAYFMVGAYPAAVATLQ